MKQRIVIISLIALLVINFQVSNASSTDVKLTYNILESNEYITWYPFDGSDAFNLSLNVDSFVLTTRNSSDLDTEFQLQFGTTKFNASDIEIDAMLALGYWNSSSNKGFLVDTNWENTKESYQSSSYLQEFSMTDQVISLNLANKTQIINIEAVMLNFTDGFQHTTLYYSKIEGILLKADTGFGNYNFSFEISNIVNISLEEFQTISTSSTEETFIYILPIVFAVFISKKFAKKLS